MSTLYAKVNNSNSAVATDSISDTGYVGKWLKIKGDYYSIPLTTDSAMAYSGTPRLNVKVDGKTWFPAAHSWKPTVCTITKSYYWVGGRDGHHGYHHTFYAKLTGSQYIDTNGNLQNITPPNGNKTANLILRYWSNANGSWDNYFNVNVGNTDVALTSSLLRSNYGAWYTWNGLGYLEGRMVSPGSSCTWNSQNVTINPVGWAWDRNEGWAQAAEA